MAHFFITGTDTGVGKTWFACWLVRAWRARGFNAAGLKPIASGDRADGEQLRAAAGDCLALDEVNPVHFREPAAPLIAAQLENRVIDFASLNAQIASARSRYSHLVVEGVGGWRVPLGPGYDVRAWAMELKLPVVVVARPGLGTLNHTLLTVESIQRAGAECAGVVVNAGRESSPDLDLARGRNVGLLRDLLRLPVLEFDRRTETAGHVSVWLGGK